jgi:hypothetical protein
MLELPDGVELLHLFADSYRDSVCVVVGGERFAEVPDGTELPHLPVDDWTTVVDTAPVMDALRRLHFQDDDGSCANCCEWEGPNSRELKPVRSRWPCATMRAAEKESLAHPLVVRRLRVNVQDVVSTH